MGVMNPVRQRYEAVLVLLNEGASEERWLLGELVRQTVTAAQEKAAAEMDVSTGCLRALLVAEAQEEGLILSPVEAAP